jgi:hypothetical protein
MKTSIIFIITILVILISYVGCSIDSSNNPPVYEYTRCFTVIDSQTKEPVEGALLRVYYDTKSGSPLGSGGGREGITDGDGSICFTIPSGAKGDGWQVFGNQYKPICKLYFDEFPPDVIEMEFECYFQFEIKNDEPFSEADNIKITYSDILECGSSNFISLNGANIDTTIIRRADPKSPSIIEVESSGANPFSKTHARIVNSRDTIIFPVFY